MVAKATRVYLLECIKILFELDRHVAVGLKLMYRWQKVSRLSCINAINFTTLGLCLPGITPIDPNTTHRHSYVTVHIGAKKFEYPILTIRFQRPKHEMMIQ